MILESVFVLLVMSAAIFDVVKLRIPNAICALLIALFLVPATLRGSQLDLINHLSAFVIVLVVGWGLFAFGLMGGGDVKLFASVALWIGLDLLVLQVVYVALLGLVLLVALLPARFAVQIVKGQVDIAEGRGLPEALRPGEGIPYGVAISAATVLLIGKMPSAFWVF